MDSFLLQPSCVNMCVFVDPLHMLRGGGKGGALAE